MIDAAARAGVDGVLPAETVRQECLRVTYALAARSPQAENHEARLPYEGCERLGGVCDCAGRPCAVSDDEHS
jgi:hypothetical protein